MGKWGDHEAIARHCERERAALWPGLERQRAGWIRIARQCYPKALGGLRRAADDYAGDTDFEDDDATRATGVPFSAFRVCVNGFYRHLTPPNAGTPWFKLGRPRFGRSAGDADLRALEELTDATAWLMRWSDAYTAVNAVWRQLVAFGTAAMLAVPDGERVVRCCCLRAGTYALGIDRRGLPDRLVRQLAMDPCQLAAEFGRENVSQTVARRAAEGDRKGLLRVWQLTERHEPGTGPEVRLDEKFGWRSVYWSNAAAEGNGRILAARGHLRQPFVAPRLNAEHGDVYGRGMGADAVGLCACLQRACRAQAVSAEQEVFPPMAAPESMSDQGLRLGPREVNWYPDGTPPNGIYPAVTPPETSLNLELVRRLEGEIRSAFYNSEFETINALEDGGGGRMTATEVRARVDEKMEQLEGVATSMDREWLDPLVTLMAGFALDAGLAEAPPDGPTEIRYESRIHAAANAARVNAGLDSVSRAAGLAANAPGIMDNFDFDEAARDTHRALGAPEKWLRDARDVEAARRARGEAEDEERDARLGAERAKAARDAAAAAKAAPPPDDGDYGYGAGYAGEGE